MRTMGWVAVAAMLAGICGCTAKEDAPPAPAVPQLQDYANVRQIMLAITIPTSDVVFQVGAQAPADDAAWDKVHANALALAESANLLQTGSRVQDPGNWLAYCKALAEAASQAANAAAAKDVDQVLAAGDQIYEVCDKCHQQYMAARGGV